jgi:hypothetical protein
LLGRLVAKHGQAEPALGVRPVIIGRRGGDADRLGRLLDRKSGKKAEPDDVGLAAILGLQRREGLVQGDQVDTGPLDGGLNRVEVNALAIPTGLRAGLPASVLDQDAAHGLGRCGEKVPTAIPTLGRIPLDEPQVGFVDQGRGLERLTRLLLRQPLGRELAQLVINQGQQLLGRFRITPLDRRENPCYIIHG